jgi:molybdopterin-guanine dinucleotide biosynthesis protein A
MGVVAAILVGGASRRMGQDKALVEVAGRPMIEIIAGAARTATEQVFTVGRGEPVAGIPSIPDPDTETRGTLPGLVAALAHARSHSVLLLAVDQPFVRSETLSALVDRAADWPVVPIDDDTRQVTCAIYPPSLLQEATTELDAGGSIQSLLDRVPHVPVSAQQWRTWGEDGRSWFSADTTAALEEGFRRFGPPAG